MSQFEYKVKRENPNDEFAILSDWAVKTGDKVSKGDYLATLESSKNNYEVEAECDGYIHYQVNEGDRLDIGETLFFITDQAQFDFAPQKSTIIEGEGFKITRKAQKIMREYQLTAEHFASFELPKIGEAEVLKYIQENRLDQEEVGIDYHDEELTPAKSYEVHFLNSASDVIYSRVSRPFDYIPMESFLSKYPGVTMGEVICSTLGNTLSKFPYLNAHFQGNKIRVYDEFNIGIAINLNKGLKVPVIKNIDSLSLEQVSHSFKELGMKYFRDELTGQELAYGTFTVTDLSSLGVNDFQPVVNKDQSAILGICAPVDGKFNLILGFDHRLVDGMYAAQFLNQLEKELLNIFAE